MVVFLQSCRGFLVLVGAASGVLGGGRDEADVQGGAEEGARGSVPRRARPRPARPAAHPRHARAHRPRAQRRLHQQPAIRIIYHGERRINKISAG